MTSLRALGLSFALTAIAACSLPPMDRPSDEPPVIPPGTSTSSGNGGTSPGTGGGGTGGIAAFACDATFPDTGVAASTAKALWARALPGRIGEHVAQFASVDGAGNVIVGDEYREAADFGGGVTLSEPPEPYYGDYIAKISASGEAVWAEKMPDRSLARLAAGKSGSLWTTTSGGTPYTIKLHRWDPSGSLVWSQSLDDTGVHVTDVIPAEGDRVIVPFGVTGEGLDYGTGKIPRAKSTTSDVAVLEYDASGSVVWARSLGQALWPDGASALHRLKVRNTARVPDGGALVLAAAELEESNADGDKERELVLLRVAPQGDVMWSRHLPEIREHVTLELDLVSGPSGEALIQASLIGDKVSADFGCGALQGPGVALAKIAPDGTPAWTRAYPGLDALLKAGFASNGDIVWSGFAVPPCDLGGGEIIPPADVEYNIRFIVARLGPDGAHRQSGYIGEIVPITAFDEYFSFVDHQDNLLVVGTQHGMDLGLGPLPDAEHTLFVAKIAP